MPVYVLRTPVFTSLGMISLLPPAMAIEIAKDPTNHNLFPFEGLLQIVWVEIGPNIRETSSGHGFQRIFPMKDTIFCAAVTMVSVVVKTV